MRDGKGQRWGDVIGGGITLEVKEMSENYVLELEAGWVILVPSGGRKGSSSRTMGHGGDKVEGSIYDHVY